MRALIASIMLTALAVGASADIVVGNGRISSEKREVSAFKTISVSGSGTLRVHKGAQKVELKSDSNILGYITTTVSGDELRIGFKPFTSLLKVSKLEYDITLPELEGVRLSGSGDAVVDAFKGNDFSGEVSGSGGIKAELDYKSVSLRTTGSGDFDATVVANELELRCSGSGGAALKGAASRVAVIISGSADIRARELEAREVDISVSGSGAIDIRATKTIDAKISGSGDVRYWGSPSVSQRVSGSGKIKKAGN
jgi:hypothetical protein